MADNSSIEWTDATWQPITGCSVVTPGCTNCYAMKLAGTRLRNHPSRAGLTIDTKAGPVWNGKVSFNEQWLLQPLAWRKPRTIFVCAHGDLFHENIPDEWIDKVFAVMALCPQHTFQVLTKRAKRMRGYFAASDLQGRVAEAVIMTDVAPYPDNVIADRILWAGEEHCTPVGLKPWPLPNVWLGVSAERQREWDERTDELRNTPAAVRFVSAEPLLGPISGQGALRDREGCANCGDGQPFGSCCEEPLRIREPGLDWVIVGGESGPDARAMHPQWARALRDQCLAAGVPFFFKQWGAWAPAVPEKCRGNPRSGWQALAAHPHVARAEELYPEAGAEFVAFVGKKSAGRLLDGKLHDEFPNRENCNGV